DTAPWRVAPDSTARGDYRPLLQGTQLRKLGRAATKTGPPVCGTHGRDSGSSRAPLPAKVHYRQNQRSPLKQGAEVERRADAPVAFGEVRHHGQEGRPDGRCDHG